MRDSPIWRFRGGTSVRESPELTRQYLRLHIGALPYEVFGLLLLDLRVVDGYVQQFLRDRKPLTLELCAGINDN